MKPLKLTWKRSDPQEPSYQAVYGPNLEAVYIAQGKVKIGDRPLIYIAHVLKAKGGGGKNPWRIYLKIDGEPVGAFPGEPTYTLAKEAIRGHLEKIIDGEVRAFAEREELIARIHAIYEAHGQKPMGKGFDGHTTSGLKKHLAALQAGKFPWKMPDREAPKEAPSVPAEIRLRRPVAESTRDLILQEVKTSLEACVREKGDGAFVSIHELRGALDEEWHELKEAMHSKDLGHIEAELKDLVVGAVFGLACIRAGVLK